MAETKRIPYQEVTIIKSPITNRYVENGSKGQIDYNANPPQIRVGGAWFNFDNRWTVVTEENKKDVFLKTLEESANGVDYLSDSEFNSVRDAFGFKEEDEDMIFQWMIESKRFRRYAEGFSIVD
jgi:hypothetical protein